MLVHGMTKLLRKSFPSLVLASLLLLLGTGTAWAATGSAYFNYQINWKLTPNLYFSVAGGPPNTCGDLVTTRNGSPLTAQNYICTDSSGNATKGPWRWAETASDQTDTNLHIRWPDGTTTNKIWHIWDKLPPNTFINSSGVPSTSYSGSATDPQWGAGFSSSWSSRVVSSFKNSTTGRYWTPSAGDYTAAPFCNAVPPIRCIIPTVNGTLSGMPGHSVTWSTPFPPPGIHVPGQTYVWETCVYDNYIDGQKGCRSIAF